ncbi:porin [Chitinasiproducens palmae]|uniref:Outer membrane protein (Porin) n=1 Tax=Chitinasiproducens palmae TaxID=1770053 RepID=A0A1H2PUP7_9BURK|nr:porin [Chitinasiproducens palmae]SDV50565.1 Outer membrane protein (porin) [Chitinasiproducens palmae]
MKTSIALSSAAGLLLGLTAPHAGAQSSVTLYGILSEGVAYVNNEGGSSAVKMLSGTNQNNRVGFRIAEDLGGGSRAIGVLENGFDVTNGKLGQGGRMFGRQAFVGLSDDRYGTLTMGRQYDMFTDYLTPFVTAVAANGLANHPGDLDNSMGSWRYSNSVKYVTPTFAGFNMTGMYGFSNQSEFAVNRMYSVGAGYRNGPLLLGAAYTEMDLPGTINTSGTASDDYAGAPFLTYHTSPLSTAVGVDKHRNVGIGGRYEFGSRWRWNVLLTNSHLFYRDGTSLSMTNYDTSLTYNVTPTLVLGGGYIYTRASYGGVASNPHWHTAQLSIDYFLSKRTDIYLFNVFQRVSGAFATADIYLNSPSTGRTQNLVVAGIRHKF